MKKWLMALVAGLTFLSMVAPTWSEEKKKVDTRVFEMRTYYAHPGKMKALHARFRDHTCNLN